MATTQEIIDYYAGLLIIQYSDKPKAIAHIETIITNVIMDQLPTQIRDGFNIDNAVGAQLDVLAKYVGVSRNSYTFSGPITLSDDDLRTMIIVASIKNSAGSSLYDIQELLNEFFPGQILVFDYRTMRMSYFFDSGLGSQDLAEVFVKENFLPKPMGVQLGAMIYGTPVDSFYGFRTYLQNTANNSPMNDYIVYETDRPWLSYSDAISL